MKTLNLLNQQIAADEMTKIQGGNAGCLGCSCDCSCSCWTQGGTDTSNSMMSSMSSYVSGVTAGNVNNAIIGIGYALIIGVIL